jgi:hypothetical protein
MAAASTRLRQLQPVRPDLSGERVEIGRMKDELVGIHPSSFIVS